MKPNFIIIGAAKCATSSLRALVSKHPDVYLLHGGRESQFFACDELFTRGTEWYESLFDDVADERAVGECSNIYTMLEVYPGTAERIGRALPSAKLIYMVRSPLSRIPSMWMEKRSHGGESVHYDFNQAVQLNREWLVDSTNYWQQISAYRAHFPDDQILVLFFEDFTIDPATEVRKCWEFLGLDPDIPLVLSRLHVNSSRGKSVPPQWLSRLRAHRTFRMAKHFVPIRARAYLKEKLIFAPSSDHPQWSPTARQWVLDVLYEDTVQLLDFCNKPATFWRL